MRCRARAVETSRCWREGHQPCDGCLLMPKESSICDSLPCNREYAYTHESTPAVRMPPELTSTFARPRSAVVTGGCNAVTEPRPRPWDGMSDQSSPCAFGEIIGRVVPPTVACQADTNIFFAWGGLDLLGVD